MVSSWAVASLLVQFFSLGKHSMAFVQACENPTLTVIFFSFSATADCECGYSVNTIDSKDITMAFTDLLETNFLKETDVSDNRHWVMQSYTAPYKPEVKPRRYGMNASESNIVSNPLKDVSKYDSGSVNGGDAGLQMYVRGGTPANNLVPISEIGTKRKDMHYGSFRTSLKMTDINGTCGAVFYVGMPPSAASAASDRCIVLQRDTRDRF